MPKIDEITKQQRLERLHLLLSRHPRGLTEAELADETGLERRSVNNYLRELETQGKAYKDGLYWLPFLLKEGHLRPFDLSPEEAITLYLGARLLAKQQDKRNEPAETALLKLASVLKADAGVGDEIEQAARELAGRPVQAGYQPIFRDMVRGYIYRKKVVITYRPLNWNKPFETTFSTYLLEPSPIGFSTYLIGHSSIVNALRAYKLERIETARLTRDDYAIPPDFPGLDILRNAWSIVSGDETVRVVLNFSPQVKARVLETRWHLSQETLDDPDQPGWLLWQVDVADTLDLLPWIRGWGSDVEVLEPVGLRKTLEKEVKMMARLYGVGEKSEMEAGFYARSREMVGKDELIAHWRKRDEKAQSLLTHLTETSALAETFAGKVGLSEIGKVLGLLHDLGKASQEYQDYLRTNEGLISPDEEGYTEAKRGEIDHSTAGAQLLFQKLSSRGREGKILAQVLALALASHHSGLIDCLKPDGKNDFQRRMNKPDENTHLTEAMLKLPNVIKQLNEIFAQPLEKRFLAKLIGMKEESDSKATLPFKHGLLTRFLLSCLLDADRLNTADFETPENEVARNYGKYVSWDVLIERLETKYTEYAQKTAQMSPGQALEVNQLRAQVAQACLETAGKPRGIYQLTVPTGGGKTEASLRFALHHAQTHKMDRVFYIVPYITIIDQNADKVREILEDTGKKGQYLDNVVLEHHSNLTPEEETRRHNLLAENWDAPIVFTTQVQFLEALFGAGTRNARRMHHLANSVIILDEVQTIPIRITNLFTTAMRFLTHDCGSTVVLCTATQPPFDKIDTYRKLHISPEQHIIQNEPALFERLKRVEVHDERKVGGWTNSEIADLAERALQEKGSVLIVVNTKASARALYQEISAKAVAQTYHLSTDMCPMHRLDVLAKVKDLLVAHEPVICVSTQLIEAGVDIDFGAVIRSLAGLDSIAQSAGRCNRHGLRDGLGSAWVVNPQEENLGSLKDIKVGREKAQTVFDDFKDNPESLGNDRIGLNSIAAYYNYYYGERQAEMDYPVGVESPVGRDDYLFNLLAENAASVDAYQRITQTALDLTFRQSFQSAAKSFQVIDSPTRGVVVPYGAGKGVITELCGAFELEKQYKLLKRAQRFSVNLYAHHFDALAKKGAIHEVQEGAGVFYLDSQYYSDDFGWSNEVVNDMEVLCL